MTTRPLLRMTRSPFGWGCRDNVSGRSSKSRLPSCVLPRHGPCHFNSVAVTKSTVPGRVCAYHRAAPCPCLNRRPAGLASSAPMLTRFARSADAARADPDREVAGSALRERAAGRSVRAEWRLKVFGQVETPYELSYQRSASCRPSMSCATCTASPTGAGSTTRSPGFRRG